MKIAEIAKCLWYKDVKQSIMHLYTKYQKWYTKHQILKKNLGKTEIQ